MRRLAYWIALLACLLAWPVHADSDHDRAREARLRGDVKPLPDILARVAEQVPGDVIEVELEREHGRWVYDLKLLQPGGRLVRLKVDARDASVIKHRSEYR